ncbi:serine/arginine-rich splicing factor 3-like [Oppia nitens]|uniref:serine/arginine-rich splicing factor 3-like n=1 Tax=Oppia nitens TaxID=1686743 RepID=UPI0023D9E238|nr:serine/arginine-rich splicing factor 3-like [Oppia nitens]
MTYRGRDACPLDCKVYVGELGNNGTRHELEDAFGYYGPLKEVWVARNPPGFAFIMFQDPRDARDAVRGLDGKILCGRRIRVELSTGKSRHDGKSGGGGGGGGPRQYGGQSGGGSSRGPPDYGRGGYGRESPSYSRGSSRRTEPYYRGSPSPPPRGSGSYPPRRRPRTPPSRSRSRSPIPRSPRNDQRYGI